VAARHGSLLTEKCSAQYAQKEDQEGSFSSVAVLSLSGFANLRGPAVRG
jgi:hypothetical protein